MLIWLSPTVILLLANITNVQGTRCVRDGGSVLKWLHLYQFSQYNRLWSQKALGQLPSVPFSFCSINLASYSLSLINVSFFDVGIMTISTILNLIVSAKLIILTYIKHTAQCLTDSEQLINASNYERQNLGVK